MTNGYASVNGLQMYYETHGSGRPLVLLHGGVVTIEMSFGRLLPLLAPDRQIIAVELQGHGHTADSDRPLTMARLAGDVVGLLDLLTIDRADIFGFSLGGFVATQLAIDYGDRLDRLVLASTPFNQDGYHRDVRDPELFATSTRMPSPSDFDDMREAYERIAPDPAHFDAFRAKVGAAVASFAGWSPSQLESIAAPTLVIIGDNDFVRVEHAEELRQLIPNAQLAILPGTTHMEVTHRVELVAPIIGRFLWRDR